eukprot:TRINITY_DN392_c0_g1_i7.p1 TRINITY_DN392_c0_g1~~TRINITY_DN392_c0_g1_i7.p1  ORF type:complete len:151 (-),score=14.99 TRINITY_DN392_c0_g1_i7:167-619(-)
MKQTTMPMKWWLLADFQVDHAGVVEVGVGVEERLEQRLALCKSVETLRAQLCAMRQHECWIESVAERSEHLVFYKLKGKTAIHHEVNESSRLPVSGLHLHQHTLPGATAYSGISVCTPAAGRLSWDLTPQRRTLQSDKGARSSSLSGSAS